MCPETMATPVFHHKIKIWRADGTWSHETDAEQAAMLVDSGHAVVRRTNQKGIVFQLNLVAADKLDSATQPRFARPGNGSTSHVYGKGALKWKEHQSNAKSGHAGGHHQMFFADPARGSEGGLAYAYWVKSGRMDKYGEHPIFAAARKAEV